MSEKVLVPLALSSVAAGFPTMTEDGVEGELDLNDLVIKHPAATFFMRVSGDSMVDAGIRSGDILVVDRSLAAEDGKVVIAVVNGELAVKRLQLRNGRAVLLSANKAYQPISISQGDSLSVWGVVTYVIHKVV